MLATAAGMQRFFSLIHVGAAREGSWLVGGETGTGNGADGRAHSSRWDGGANKPFPDDRGVNVPPPTSRQHVGTKGSAKVGQASTRSRGKATMTRHLRYRLEDDSNKCGGTP